MLNESIIIEKLESLHEHKMAKDIFVPVLKALGCKGVRFTGGCNEQGIDVEYYELTKPENHKSYVGIQFKKGDLVYSAGGAKNSIREIKNQAEEAFDKGIPFENAAQIHYIGRFVVATTGEINDKAREMINKAKMKGADRRITYWSKATLVEYIQDYWMDEFVEYFSIDEDLDDFEIETPRLVDTEYIDENYTNLVRNCIKVRATISGFECKILDAVIKKIHFEDEGRCTLADLLFEIGKKESYIESELRNLVSLEYIVFDENDIWISGKAKYLVELSSKIIEELDDAEEYEEGLAVDIYDSVLG